jgi:Uma2 family endonuclease
LIFNTFYKNSPLSKILLRGLFLIISPFRLALSKNKTSNMIADLPTTTHTPTTPAVPNGRPKYISWADFQRKYLTREDGYKYEWLNGTVEKTKRTMDRTQFFIIRNLQACLRQLLNAGKVDGELITEGDIFFLEKHRRPDLVYLTNQQIEAAADGDMIVPQFIIEVISSTDGINRVNKKIVNYRAAGVKVVWHIFPEEKEIQVYGGENLDSVQILRGEKICSAAPVLPDFEMTVNAVFERKK